MSSAFFTGSFLLFILFILFDSGSSSREAENNSFCNGIEIRYPFTYNLSDGGHFLVDCHHYDHREKRVPRIQLPDDVWHAIQNISYDEEILVIRDEHPPDSDKEDYLYNFTDPVYIKDHPLFEIKLLEEKRTLSECKKHAPYCLCDDFSPNTQGCAPNCINYVFFHSITSVGYHGVHVNCSSSEKKAFFEWKMLFNESGELLLLSAGFSQGVITLRPDCFEDNATRGYICMKRNSNYSQHEDHSNYKDIAIGTGVSIGVCFIAAMLIGLLLLYRHRKRKLRSSTILLSRNGSIEPSFSKEDPLGAFSELSVSRYRTHIFTFEELHEATDGFCASNELGDGGFGIVYKGVLRDGRVVAVKRLYQKCYRRLEQFMNEVDILSDLRHPNLVVLYGCTSRHTRDLLLVYEYVPNGTVADHLYGVQADAGLLTWPTRMSIAIETADALGYLHDDGIQIIHRDVKTNNILLDDDFHVKVADFGLSRLFPTNATHVTTAPQGTPGYLDPEYHELFQLTEKSDVYSFGVVLAELISSKPAVDVTRPRSEINLSNMAINKIQKQELDQFVDPRLGYQSDSGTREMIDSVAEVAFRCLQLQSDMRPTMKEVVEALMRIRSRGREAETRGIEADVESKEDAHLLKNAQLDSPNSIAERWASVATTVNASG